MHDRFQDTKRGWIRQVAFVRILVLLWWLPLFFGASAAPVVLSRVPASVVHHNLTGYALTDDDPSAISRIALSQLNLLEQYDDAPEQALTALHKAYLGEQSLRHYAFALAELSFLHAEQTHQRAYYLAAALYAYAFLFPDNPGDAISPFDRSFRQACDLYNRALTDALKTVDGQEVQLGSGSYELPFGKLEVTFRDEQLLWAGRRLEHFIPVAELEIHGIRNHYRIPGIGTPLAAAQAPLGDEQGFKIGPNLKVPVTALLRIEQLRQQLKEGTVRASLELYPAMDTLSAQIGGRTVPLEIEFTSVLAYSLAESPIWKRELKGFFMGDLATRVKTAAMAGLEPYRPGRFPVVFVHGTASSPGRWADMVNDLLNDRRLRNRFQFWLFTYNTGNPVAYSAMLLRDELEKAAKLLDPERRDPAFQRMVVIGHSQGRLLTKLTAVKTEDRLWKVISKKPLDQMDIPEDEKTLFRQALFVEPVPSVRRVVLIATPHRGSFQALTRTGAADNAHHEITLLQSACQARVHHAAE